MKSETKNREHVENLNSLGKLKKSGFEGPDKSLSESLSEYGISWLKYQENGEGWLLVVYSIGNGKFARVNYPITTIIRKEWDWVFSSESNLQALLDHLSGAEMDMHDFFRLPLERQIYDIMNVFGWENIFGPSYWEGFIIKGLE